MIVSHDKAHDMTEIEDSSKSDDQTVRRPVEHEFALAADSDMGFAILVAADFDRWLGTQILNRIVRSGVSRDEEPIDELQSRLQKELFSSGRLLSSFRRKIEFAYALGFFGANLRAGLEAANSIRNTFAHSPERLSFDHEKIDKDCQRLELDSMHNTQDSREKYRSYLIEARRQIARRLWD